ncbi:MAG: Gfo/Idh/MocA family oxidoreductase [Haliscomenobacter sp.]|nr:putative oxidoreductase C-terminal domain-containing protein [Haliscomenobacter sp.]MBK9488463.1 Gfo/Idh/MocA family oxidoreductase [Haliscomenobacter sp.]
MYKSAILLSFLATCFFACSNQQPQTESVKLSGAKNEIKLMTLDPGHFHAALVQKNHYPQVDSMVYIYAPDGPELKGHLARIESYNQREAEPTHWASKVYTGADYLEKMLSEKPGNVVVISGNNAQKTHYIQSCIEAGINVLADKPMAIKPADFTRLQDLFPLAEKKGVLLYDIMTERHEISTMLQRELAQMPALFGTLEKGTPENPAITKESVHHFFKYVSGSALIRPAWFFDVEQQGEGVVDVSTHLVDLVLWECFPEQSISYQKDIQLQAAKRGATDLTSAQFKLVTGLPGFPSFLKKDLSKDSTLKVFANGETHFSVKGVHAKVSVIWNFQAPEGAGDTHFSIMRGTKANLIIRQGAAEKYRPVLYVEPLPNVDKASAETALKEALKKLNAGQFQGLGYEASEKGWKILIPDSYNVGHEAHFAQVTEKYLQYLAQGKLPEWEVPNMLAKYYVTTKAYEMSRTK